MSDVLGAALSDYQNGIRKFRLSIYNMYGKREIMPVSIYFRSLKECSALELIALEACRGKVLDIGAAAGCHSLILQDREYQVTAIDMSRGASLVMKKKRNQKCNYY